MGSFGRKRKDLAEDGPTGSAVIRSIESADFWDEHARDPDDPSQLEINWDRFLAEGTPGETRALTAEEAEAARHSLE
jgi:hypothetical protein